jgi:ParB family transcriptional regulator, chromosome partitioning protein
MAGAKRRDELKALFGVQPQHAQPALEEKSAEPPPPSEDVTRPAEPPRAASGAVRAMGLSLGSIARDAEEARNLRQALEEGERIVELDCAIVEGSFVEDRFARTNKDDEGFTALSESIRESGQQVPILVRPHPAKPGYYQTAYGHRRLAAVRSLGLKVKAIIRALTDDQLVLAQGKENAERRDLTFIERAFFAQALVKRGFDRKVVEDALGIQKSEVSRLLQVADSVPIQFAHAVGPAPKAGRERWMALGAFFAKESASAIAADEIRSERFRAGDSNRRFQILFDRLARKQKEKPDKGEALSGRDGKPFGKIYVGRAKPRIEFSAPVSDTFLNNVARLIEEAWEAQKHGEKDT